jgi:hypothetical protein
MDISNCKEQPTKQEDVATRKEVKEEDAGSGNSSTEIFDYGAGPDYQIYIPLGWAPW